MRDLLLSIEFWVAMSLAVALKLRASPRITLFGASTTTICAVGAALVFTTPVMDYLALGDSYTHAVAALVALTFEHIMRQILDLGIEDAVKIWRGKK